MVPCQEGTVKKILTRVAAVLGVLLLVAVVVGAVLVYRMFEVTEQRLDKTLTVLLGGGGNTAALSTDRGVVVVDTKLWIASKSVRDAVAKLGATRALINTHYHPDHTHGNPLFAPGIPVIAAGATRGFMEQLDGDFWKGDPARSMLPNQPIEADQRIDYVDEVVQLVPLPPAHTGGDLAVLFTKHRVLHAGDVVVNGYYPIVDVKGGGRVRTFVEALDRMLQLPFDTVIPGHGAVGGREVVQSMRDYVAALWEYAQRAAAEGKTAAEAARAAPPALRGRARLYGFSSLEDNLKWAIAEAGGPKP
jgi:cyclase